MSDSKHRLGIWAVVFFVLVVSLPGWFVQMRLIEKIGRLERRVAELESPAEAEAQEQAPLEQ